MLRFDFILDSELDVHLYMYMLQLSMIIVFVVLGIYIDFCCMYTCAGYSEIAEEMQLCATPQNDKDVSIHVRVHHHQL